MNDQVAMLAIVGCVAVTFGLMHYWNQERIRVHEWDRMDGEDTELADDDDDERAPWRRSLN